MYDSNIENIFDIWFCVCRKQKVKDEKIPEYYLDFYCLKHEKEIFNSQSVFVGVDDGT